ncbi:MAG TPA: hypothetical protein VKX46_02715, partial [Ktedonobacteraceae bacterium]|nr:hypothetical protein [Ktedonobacteraceae bacterium]
NVTADSGASPQLPAAYTTGQPSPLAVSINETVDGLGNLTNSLSVGLNGDPSSLFGIQSLLDLMLMGVFESTDVF